MNMMDFLNKIFGTSGKVNKIKQSKFSRFSHDASSSYKKKVIEKVVKEANRDQRKVVEKAAKLRAAH